MESTLSLRSRRERRPRPACGAAAVKRLRPAVEQLEDRTTPALLGTPTPVVSLLNFGPPVGNALTANLLFTLPGGAQQVAQTRVFVTSLQRTHSTTILNLTLGPVHLDVLGLVVDLNQVNIRVQAIPGRGQLLGNLLAGTHLNTQALLTTLSSELNALLGAGNLLSNLTAPASPLGTGAALNTAQLSNDLNAAGIAPGTMSCPVLNLQTGPIDLDLLGLNVLVSPIHLTVTAVPSSQPGGGALGDLLCQLSHALDNPSAVAGHLTAADLTNIVNSLVNTLGHGPQTVAPPLSLAGLPRGALASAATTAAATHGTTNILSLMVAPINLNLLGLQVTTSPICLTVSAQGGAGNLLGNLLGGLLGGTGGGLGGLGGLLGSLAALGGTGGGTAGGLLSGSPVLQRVISELATNLGSTTNPTASCPILNLTLGPLNLDLLGLIVTLNNCATPPGPVTVNVTAIPGAGNLLGNLLCDLAGLVGTPA